jgi:hypothetical protein
MSRTLTKKSKQHAAAFALVIATLATSLSVVAAPPAPLGGTGKLRLNGTGITCFKTSSKRVPLVCGKPQVHYKITTMMGDPLASYAVTWSLFSLHIANLIGGGSQNYLAGSVPGKLWDAAKGMELSLYGAAIVKGSSPMVALQFNTGLGVKPGGELSLNVPDGYNWDKFLIYEKDGMGAYFKACYEDDLKYVAPADAKRLMRSGMTLEGLQVCPRSSVDTDRLDRAIDAFCEANPKNSARFCPKEQEEEVKAQKKGEPPDPFSALSNKPSAKADARQTSGSKEVEESVGSNALDELADRDFVRKILAQQREDFRNKADQACSTAMQKIDACISSESCPGSDPALCSSIPPEPRSYSKCLKTWSGCINCQDEMAVRREQCAGLSDQDADMWESKWGAQAKRCSDQKKLGGAEGACHVAAKRRCNPSAASMGSCMSKLMSGPDAPTFETARMTLSRDRAKKSQEKQGAVRRNFLD